MEESVYIDAQKEDVESPVPEEIPQVFRTYKIRFFGLAMIALANISSAMNWLAVAPVPDFANSFFNDCGLSTINWFSNIFMLSYVVAGPFSSWVFDKWSLKVGVGVDIEGLNLLILLMLSHVANYRHSFTDHRILAPIFFKFC
jgi:hypothetical protein